MRRSDQTWCYFVTNGDLTEPEFQTLHQLTAANQRTVLIFNKQDQYLPEERAAVLLSAVEDARNAEPRRSSTRRSLAQ